MLEYWIWLSQRRVSDRVKNNLLQQFHTPKAVYRAPEEELKKVPGITAEGIQSILERDLFPSRKILQQCSQLGIRFLTMEDAEYPDRLKQIYDPPVLLYYKGILPDFDRIPVIATVGTRKCSAYGAGTARRLGYEITKCGGLVVSGLAAGIDAAAMKGALTAEGPVVGVLGCGLDVVYPRSSKELYALTEQYGCLLSEFAPGTPPTKYHFPKRNRIISGLSCGVVVVEAPASSGALITAKTALEQGRDVFAVPGNVDLDSFAGSNELLRDGAGVISCGWDVMQEYQAKYPESVHREQKSIPLEKNPEIREEPEEKPKKDFLKVAQKKKLPVRKTQDKSVPNEKSIDKVPAKPYSDLSDTIQRLPEDEKRVACAIGSGEKLVDDVIAEAGLPSGKVLAMLTLLEVKKIITRHPGKRVSLNTGKPN